jgi:hypothetical protein
MTSSLGRMTFPIYGKIKNKKQTTNQIYIEQLCLDIFLKHCSRKADSSFFIFPSLVTSEPGEMGVPEVMATLMGKRTYANVRINVYGFLRSKN